MVFNRHFLVYGYSLGVDSRFVRFEFVLDFHSDFVLHIFVICSLTQGFCSVNFCLIFIIFAQLVILALLSLTIICQSHFSISRGDFGYLGSVMIGDNLSICEFSWC
ncbi:hypothetical protein Dimus_006110 [Dionaea muscipula]